MHKYEANIKTALKETEGVNMETGFVWLRIGSNNDKEPSCFKKGNKFLDQI
jgi:hypothetical protein